MTLPAWLDTLQDDVFNWLMKLQDPHHPGRFRFSQEGNLFYPSDESGLDASALALKIVYMVGALPRIKESDLQIWLGFIQSFQQQETPAGFLKRSSHHGFFIDNAFLSYKESLFVTNTPTRRAVTRQACAALMCGNAAPRYPVTSIPQTIEETEKFLNSFNWRRPWASGSHVSHLLFFLKLNNDYFGMSEPYETLVPFILEWLNTIRNPRTGSWYRGNPPLNQKINGAMKILTGYGAVDRSIENPEPLIDFCLNAAAQNTGDGCHNTDILYVLHYCQKYTDYRKTEIQQFARERIEIIEAFRKQDGGFSFFLNRSQTRIYGVPVTKGLPVSDIHGTTLFLWGLIMAIDILEQRERYSFQLPIT